MTGNVPGWVLWGTLSLNLHQSSPNKTAEYVQGIQNPVWVNPAHDDDQVRDCIFVRPFGQMDRGVHDVLNTIEHNGAWGTDVE